MATPALELEAYLDADHLAALNALPVRQDPADHAARRAAMEQLRAANVPTELRVYPGAFHGSPSLVPDSELSRRWKRDELSALDRALNDPR